MKACAATKTATSKEFNWGWMGKFQEKSVKTDWAVIL
jgi:hypothetical protein